MFELFGNMQSSLIPAAWTRMKENKAVPQMLNYSKMWMSNICYKQEFRKHFEGGVRKTFDRLVIINFSASYFWIWCYYIFSIFGDTKQVKWQKSMINLHLMQIFSAFPYLIMSNCISLFINRMTPMNSIGLIHLFIRFAKLIFF